MIYHKTSLLTYIGFDWVIKHIYIYINIYISSVLCTSAKNDLVIPTTDRLENILTIGKQWKINKKNTAMWDIVHRAGVWRWGVGGHVGGEMLVCGGWVVVVVVWNRQMWIITVTTTAITTTKSVLALTSRCRCTKASKAYIGMLVKYVDDWLMAISLLCDDGSDNGHTISFLKQYARK